MEKIRIQKIIAQSGLCSRRKAEELIAQDLVTVNDELAKLGDKASSQDIIKVDNKEIKSQEEKVYIALNKPEGYTTTNEDRFAERKLIDLIDIPQRIFPVGRLDKDTEGLIFLTNDGEWANKISHPSFEKEKEYYVELNKSLHKDTLDEINKGFTLEDGHIKPRARLIRDNSCSVIIHEGKNRIVKRIFRNFNYHVTKLIRVRIGKFKLGNLKVGEWRYIKPNII
ncbi:MAG: rRNA pseudouridine synthase [Parcubacteria group bacterium]|nr:rRNA pseudouridine synthase [Parcubacteria group bacterium]